MVPNLNPFRTLITSHPVSQYLSYYDFVKKTEKRLSELFRAILCTTVVQNYKYQQF